MSKADRKKEKPAGKVTITNTGDIPVWVMGRESVRRGDGEICLLRPGETMPFSIDKVDGDVSVSCTYGGVVADLGNGAETAKEDLPMDRAP